MANSKITDLNPLLGSQGAATDLATVVDVSDTTMSGSGTNKKIAISELAILIAGQVAFDSFAPLASPTFTGSIIVPTPTASTHAARKDYVDTSVASATAAINDIIAGAPGALDTLNELAAAIGDDADFAGTITAALSNKQPLDPDLTTIAAANNAAVLAATTASFTTADETKLDGLTDDFTIHAAEAGTTFTLTAAKLKGLTLFTAAGAVSVTVPPGTFAAGDWFRLQSVGAGGLSLVTTGLTLNGNAPKTSIAQNEGIDIVFTATDAISVFGGTS